MSLQYLSTFVVAGATVSAISYIGNNMNPLVGGIVSSIPNSLPSLLLIHKHSDQLKFAESASLMLVLLTVCTILCFVAMKHWKMSGPVSVGLGMGLWAVGAVVYYMVLRKHERGGRD